MVVRSHITTDPSVPVTARSDISALKVVAVRNRGDVRWDSASARRKPRFECVECRTLPENRGVASILHNGLVDDDTAEAPFFEILMTGLDLG